MPTLHTSETTHQGVLPQPPALESTPADNPGVGTKRGVDDRRATGRTTGVQHGRGETPGGLTNHQERRPSSPEHSGGEGDRGLAVPRITVSRVFVLDKHGHPLMPCHPARARKLLASRRARVHHLAPFVIRLVDRTTEDSAVQGVEVGIDPGSKATGISVFRTTQRGRQGLVSVEVQHRGQLIHKKLGQRAGYRRRRRTTNLRYRAPRFNNRTRPAGWLPPSTRHRVDTTVSVVTKLRRWAPVVRVHQELVRFDMQKLEHPEISGVEYQQGTLAGFEVREYLLAKWNRTCAYCGATDVPLNIDHIHPRSKGGSNRVSNLAVACVPCNEKKGNRPIGEFLAGDRTRLVRVLAQAKAPLKDAAAVNVTRWALHHELVAMFGRSHVSVGSGGRTKWNRTRFGVPKSHTLDALCVGKVTGIISYPGHVTVAKATGRGKYQRTVPDKHGFPRLRLPRTKSVHGFATGDLVRAAVPTGKYAGVHVGRVAVRSSGSFHITATHTPVDVHHRHCALLQRSDGYGWSVSPEGVPNAA